ncbi:MAG: PolC-type DNA polymerase III, partial [Lachnospiraceae bacterium]|nr:PolC-type DNA polymerase III [Lachnospiraceae bacterium]
MLFFKAFDSLSVDKELKNLYGEVEVLKVLASKSTKNLYICITSTRLINRQNIRKMEELLNKQLFLHTGSKAFLRPQFELSTQYNFEKLYPIYRDSLLEELKEKSIVSYQILANAEVSIEELRMKIVVTESCVTKEKSTKLKDFLETVFQERFSYNVHVVFEYTPAKEKDKDQELEYSRQLIKMVHREDSGKGYAAASGNQTGESAVNMASYSEPFAAAGANPDNLVKEGDAFAPSRQSGSYDSSNKFAAGGRKSAYEKGKSSYRKLPKDPSVVYGRNFEGNLIPICDILAEIGEVIIRGKLIKPETRAIRNEKTIITFILTDFTDSIKVKLFVKNIEVDEIMEELKPGEFFMLKGIAQLDTFEHDITISSVAGMKKINDFTESRKDNFPKKRVELHAHTQMSDMDGVTDVKKMVKRAFAWGHPAIAITDHGVVQSFPDASHAINPKDYVDEEEKQRAKDFKIIYGMEAYLVDDIKEVVTDAKGQSLQNSFVVFDIETTGFSAMNDRIIEIGAVKVVGGEAVDTFSTFVNPEVPIPYEIEQLTSIRDDMVMDAPKIEAVLPDFLAFCEGSGLVAHNASFDVGFIKKNAERMGISIDFTVIDTVGLSRILLPELSRFKLNTVAKALKVSLENHHRAVDDAGATAEIFIKLCEMLRERDITKVDEIDKLGKLPTEAIRKLPSYHAIMLAQNDIGRVNLYKMVSLSHLEYFHKRPKIPKSLLNECREGIILGSACEAGELYRAIISNKSPEDIHRIVNYYDYLEIQPLCNNEFLLRSERSNEKDITSWEDLIDINKKIVALGEEYNKPVVATCDVHFLDPEDDIYRKIIMAGKGFKDADEMPALYFRTTEEMLKEFSYLGSEKAEEVVITNTNQIADRIEKISPVRPDKCPPVLENSDGNLRQICYDKAYSMYGDPLPKPVQGRLEHELDSIIKNGFAVMYIIAQKLVWKSNEDGYLVGSRGSVGSSFVATMSGITEVNPLPPHYYCMNCHYADFDSEEVKQYAGSSGCDMPDRICPKCGKPLCKDGHDIPFETFLGFNGDKEPDIDLNFSGEYQSKAHDYTEVIFGKGQTFRAGTIGTLAEKTAYGYVKNYFEERGIHKRYVEIERMVEGCVGVRRTTGQHPGGIVVLPLGENIYSFTPVQHPANDMTTSTITTHFDYHSIDHNLLKLDILGHDDPTMIRMLEDLTGIDAQTIRFDDPKVLSLFHDLSALGITPQDL